MALRYPDPVRQQYHIPAAAPEDTSSRPVYHKNGIEDSQEWILFSPSCANPKATSKSKTSQTAGLSCLSDFGSFDIVPESTSKGNLDQAHTEDGELDSLDEGLYAFRTPSVPQPISSQGLGAVLPAHDGLGSFQLSRRSVQEQLWQHEQYRSKRKSQGSHCGRTNDQRRTGTMSEMDPQISEEKRLRIEQWRTEQSQALLLEVEQQTKRESSRDTAEAKGMTDALAIGDDRLLRKRGVQCDESAATTEETRESEPLWRRFARKFIQDVIGIDEPLLSIIVGETLPEDVCTIAQLTNGPPQSQVLEHHLSSQYSWPDRLLRRIARELGLLMYEKPVVGDHRIPSHHDTLDYAGIPVDRPVLERPNADSQSNVSPVFSPTIDAAAHLAGPQPDHFTPRDSDALFEVENIERERVHKEQEYWERELDIKMVFRFLKGRLYSGSDVDPNYRASIAAPTTRGGSNQRAEIIRRHHPLVARPRHTPSNARRKDSRFYGGRRPMGSSCASESMRSGHQRSITRSVANTHAHWGSAGGNPMGESILTSGTLMGAWGQV